MPAIWILLFMLKGMSLFLVLWVKALFGSDANVAIYGFVAYSNYTIRRSNP